MQRCYNSAVRMPKEPWLCCYGAPGCTAAPLSSKPLSSSHGTTMSSGNEPKQESGSELKCQRLNLTLSEDASLQDLYLILSALYAGGSDVSVSVQATPSKESAPLPSDIVVLCGSLTTACRYTELHTRLAALYPHLRSTTPSSKQSGSSEWCPHGGPPGQPGAHKHRSKRAFYNCHREHKGCLGKLQEGKE